MRNPVTELIRKFVCVEGNGTRYFGTLIEVNEDDVILKTESRWITVPLERVIGIREVDPRQLEIEIIEDVDADEFTPDWVRENAPAGTGNAQVESAADGAADDKGEAPERATGRVTGDPENGS